MTADEIAERGGVLLVRHQRPHAAHLRLLARRRREVPEDLPGEEDPREAIRSRRSTRRASARWCAIGVEQGPADAAGSEDRHLRRARRRPGVDPLLREGRARLRQLLAVPRAGRAPGGGAGGAGGQGRGLALNHDLRPPQRPDASRRRASIAPGSRPARGVFVWVDLAAPSIPESLDPQRHLSVPPAVGRGRDGEACSIPKVEAYDGYLYVILHGIDFHAGRPRVRDARRRLLPRPTYLVTVHDGHAAVDQRAARARHAQPEDPRRRPGRALPPHRRLDGRPLPAGDREARGSARRARESRSSTGPNQALVRRILEREARGRRRCAASSRRSATSIARLARREFVDISTEMSFRFRDIYDHLVRIADDAMIFQDGSPACSTRTCRTSATG